ncbi:MAG: DUF3467 domain-containing protein [Acidobacteriia bacterium]|nr:DUF3467 domain-containing protein [Terriglobia bacterium]
MATKTPAKIKRAPIKIEMKRERSHDFFSVYANELQLQTTPWDLRLVFGEVSSAIDLTNTLVSKQLGEVRVSPQLAKRIVMIMVEHLRDYESKFGPIPAIPKEPGKV